MQPKKGEFLYKNKGPLTTRDDIERWAYYALSHAPVIPGRGDKKLHAITYFGSCSNRKLKHTWIHRCSVPLVCEQCGAPMIQEGTNEIFFIRRTFADWIYSETGFDKTKNPAGPPKMGDKHEKTI